MRLIDADALINRITNPYEQAEVARWVNKMPTISGWISVKDRLPKKDEDVIIYGKFIGASGTEYPETHITDIDEFIHSGYVPIAWMPLPEPPQC